MSGIGQYQWGQQFNQSSTSPIVNENPLTTADNQSPLSSPDDGYAVFDNVTKGILAQAAMQQTAFNTGSG